MQPHSEQVLTSTPRLSIRLAPLRSCPHAPQRLSAIRASGILRRRSRNRRTPPSPISPKEVSASTTAANVEREPSPKATAAKALVVPSSRQTVATWGEAFDCHSADRMNRRSRTLSSCMENPDMPTSSVRTDVDVNRTVLIRFSEACRSVPVGAFSGYQPSLGMELASPCLVCSARKAS